MRVLHVVENLHRGSVERWLLRTLRHAETSGQPFDWTFYCTLPEPGELEAAAAAAGVRIIHSPVPLADKAAFLWAFRREVQRGGYDVIHAHHDFMSAAYYWASIGLGCRRITHIHNTDEALPTPSRLKRALALELMRRTCLVMSDRILATSQHALHQFLRSQNPAAARCRVHYCSIDLEQYWSLQPDRAGVRAELELEPDAEILLFVGSMIDLKNPLFLIEMLPHMISAGRNIAAVFVGIGPEQNHVALRAKDLGVADRVRVLGWRGDVHRLMSASDLFVNPRREHPIEGFGIVNVEAQAVGLRMIVSDGISSEPLVDGSIYARVPLMKGAEEWARIGLELLKRPRLSSDETKQLFQGSRFDPDFAVHDLHEIYRGLFHKPAGI